MADRKKGTVPFLGALLLLATSCGIAHKNYLRAGGEGRPEWKRSGLGLQAKAELFSDKTGEFLSPFGTLVYKQPANGPFRYSSLGDVCDWTGVALGAESFRYAVTESRESLERAKLLLSGLEFLHEISGVRGLFARMAVPPEGLPISEGGTWYEGKGRFEGWRWKGDVSKDQYSGALFGLYAAYENGDDDLRRRVAALAAAIADHLIANDFELHDPGEKPTSYGNVRGTVWLLPIGVNALISLSALKLAAQTSGDSWYRENYEKWARAWADNTYWAKFQIFGKTNYNNDLMAFLGYYPLLRMEDEPEFREEYLAALRRHWSYVYREGNAFFTMVAAAFGEADATAIEEARLTLDLFQTDLRDFAYDHRDEPRFSHAWLGSRKGRLKAKYPIPINWRGPSSMAWRDDPSELEGSAAEKGESRYPGYDYLVAYWMGRFFHLVPPDSIDSIERRYEKRP